MTQGSSWKVQAEGSTAGFKAPPGWFGKKGSFTAISGSVDAPDGAQVSLSIEIEVASMKTSSDSMTKNLLADKYFDAAAHPKFGFTAGPFPLQGERKRTVTGNLTIKGVTHPTEFTVQLGKDLTASELRVKASARFLRSMFGLFLEDDRTPDKVEAWVDLLLRRV